MKKACILTVFLLLLCSACAAPRNTQPAAGKAMGGIFTEIDDAVIDVASNTETLVSLYTSLLQDTSIIGGISYWEVAVAHTIPDQPVAVIRLMAKFDEPFGNMCPRDTYDDLSFAEYVEWMEKAIAALESFTLDDSKEESCRKTCLQGIHDFLAKKEDWRYY